MLLIEPEVEDDPLRGVVDFIVVKPGEVMEEVIWDAKGLVDVVERLM